MPIPRHASIHVSWGDWGTLPLHHATGITCKIAGVELELYVITPSVQNHRAREDLSGASSPGDIALRSRVPVSGYRFSNFMFRHQSRLSLLWTLLSAGLQKLSSSSWHHGSRNGSCRRFMQGLHGTEHREWQRAFIYGKTFAHG